MSTSIEEKVIAIKLKSAEFEASARKALGTLGDLAKGLKLDGVGKGFQKITESVKKIDFSPKGLLDGIQKLNSAATRVDLAPVASATDQLVNKFNNLAVVGVTALATISNKAVNAGMAMASSLTIAPVKAGFDEYELKMGSIQTMLANTSRYGTELPEVTRNLEELNAYADQTIYNFGDMTKNIGLFTNAGIRIGDATKMIQGFSNVAAASGTSSSGAAQAAYQLSQALSAGKITIMDWRSLTTVGMGNKNMQTSILGIAEAMGTLKKGTKESQKAHTDFNGSLESGWLKASVMSTYLKTMATDYGLMSEAQLKSAKQKLMDIGLSKQQTDELVKQQIMAQKSATEVRTWTQLVGVVRESIGSGWSSTFETIVGDFTGATKLFTAMNNAISIPIKKMTNARNFLLEGWAKLGGRTVLIEALKNVFQALSTVLGAVRDGFRAVFPATTAKELLSMTKSFRDFTASLKMGGEKADQVKRIFAGIFAIFKVGWTIIKGVGSTILNLFGMAQSGSGGFLAIAASIGDIVVAIQTWLVSSGRIKSFFSTINTARANILMPIFAVIGKIGEALVALFAGDFSGFGEKLGEAFSGLGAVFQGFLNSVASPFTTFLANVRDGAGAVGHFLSGLKNSTISGFGDALTKVSQIFGEVRTAITTFSLNAFNSGTSKASSLLDRLKSALSYVRDIVVDFGFGLFNKGAEGADKAMGGMAATGEKVASVWEGVQAKLAAIGDFIRPFTQDIAKIFHTVTRKISEWIGSMNMGEALSVVNTGFFIMLFKSLKDFTGKAGTFIDDIKGSFEGVAGSIKGTFGALTDNLKTMQQSVKVDMILKIAVAIGILAASLWVLSTIEPMKLAASLAGVGALLAMITYSMKTMLGVIDEMENAGLASMGMILATSVALAGLALAVLILSVAVKNLSGLSWEEMAKGLIATGVLIGALTLFTKYATLDKSSVAGAANLILLAAAVWLLSYSVEKLGKMDTVELIKGGVAIAAIIASLSLASAVMGKVGGKGAMVLLAMAGAMWVLAQAIVMLGALPKEDLIKGVLAISVALYAVTMSAVAISVLGKKAGPGLIAMALALAALAGVVYIFGTMDFDTLKQGMIAMAIGLTIMTVAVAAMGILGAQAAPGLIAMSLAMVILAGVVILLSQQPWEALKIGLMALAAGLGIVIIAGALAYLVAPGLAALSAAMFLLGAGMVLMGVGFLAFATGFAAFAAIGTAGFAVITAGAMSLMALLPIMAQQIGLSMIAIAKVFSESGPTLVAALTTLIGSLLAAIDNNVPKMLATAGRLIIALLSKIVELTPKILDAMGRVLMAIVSKIVELAPQIIDRFLQLVLALLDVIRKRIPEFATKAREILQAMIKALGDEAPQLADEGAKTIVKLVNGIAKAIENNSAEMTAAGKNVATAIVEGMANGISGGLDIVVNAARNLASSALNTVKSLLGVNSPSREFAKLGAFSAQGYAKGLDGSKAQINAAAKTMQQLLSKSMMNAVKDAVALEKKLKGLKTARHKDTKAIKATTLALAQARAEVSRTSKAQRVASSFKDEMKKLNSLSDQATSVQNKLKAAKASLAEVQKSRNDYAKTVADQFDALPTIGEDTKLSDFVKGLEDQVVKTQIFTAQLKQLHKMGLSDTMYKELLGKGVAAIPFATQLLNGGKASIDQVNVLSKTLENSAKALGNTAANDMYQAAINSAAGLVKGLQSQQGKIEAEMDKIAGYMVKSIKKALGIKSPSRAFAEIGRFSVMGMAEGLKTSASLSEAAAESVGHDTINALRKTISGLSSTVMEGVEVDPTIRPVLDLTAIKRDSVKMEAILGGNAISIGSTLASARSAASGFSSNQSAQQELAMANANPGFTFNQYNSSPEALSDATIYRNTKNQISAAKGALKN